MNWSDKHGTKTEEGDYIKKHLEGVVTFNISFSSSQQGGYSYSSNKLKGIIYPALEIHALSVLCLHHMFVTHG